MKMHNVFKHSNINVVNNATYIDGKWVTDSTDSHFILKESFIPKPGWWKVKLKITADTDVLPKIYFDLGNGFNEMEGLSLRHIKKDLYTAIVVLRAPPVSLRLDPVGEACAFSIDALYFTRPSIISVFSVTMKRVATIVAKNPTIIGDFAATMKRAAIMVIKNPREGIPKVLRHAKSLFKSAKLHNIPSTQIPLTQKTSFQIWQNKFDYKPGEDNEALERDLNALFEKPRISIVMPVYNTDNDLLNMTINSVRNQVYQNWELCICNDNSSEKHIKKTLDAWQETDDRIKVKHREQNGHISKASDTALELVTSDWVALLDHDDVLTENALAEVVKAINKYPEAEVFYSDEDKLDAKGNRYDPHFKSDFSPDLFRSMNYLNHLTVHKTDNIKKVGGWRHDFIGSQDYDLNLRIWELIRDDQIIHIPKILYHWRAVKGSTALDIGEKGYAVDAGLRALNEHLQRLGESAKAVSLPDVPFYRIKHDLPKDLPLVSLIIPTKDGVDLVRDCIRSIYEKSGYPNFEIILINNNSEEEQSLEYFEILNRTGVARVLDYPHPFNYSAINNFAVKHAKGSIIGLINNDIEAISEGWLREMVSLACRDTTGCVGAKLYFANDTLQHGGVIVGIGGVAGHSHKYLGRYEYGYFCRTKVTQNLSAVTAACLLVKKSIYQEVCGLNEDNLKVAFNDVDFCLKVRAAGYLNTWTPFAELYHYESISRGAEDNPEKVERFNSEVNYMLRTWSKELSQDPYYSPNLSLEREDFSIKT